MATQPEPEGRTDARHADHDGDTDDDAWIANASVLAFDTETTDFNGVVVQLGWCCLDREGNVLRQHEDLICLPPRVTINPRARAVHHIDEHVLSERGKSAAEVLGAFRSVLSACRRESVPVVAHNASFDVRALRRTAAAHEIADAWTELDAVFCTMRGAASWYRTKTGNKKSPKNDELFTCLTGITPESSALHAACVDATLTARSFFEGRRQSVFE